MSKHSRLEEEDDKEDDNLAVKDPFVNLPIYGEHKRAVSAVALAPSQHTRDRGHNGAALCASASADATVKLWDLKEDLSRVGEAALQAASRFVLSPMVTLVGHSRGINHVAWSQGAGHPYLATASDDKTLRLWDVPTGEPLVEFRGHSNFCFCVNFNPGSSNLLVSGSFDETVKLWDVRSGVCVATLPAHSDPVTAAEFLRDGTCVVSASHDGLIRIWDVATGECLKTIFASGNPPVSHVTFSPNGQYVLASTLDSKLRLWRVFGAAASSTSSQAACCKTYTSPQHHTNTKYCIQSAFVTSNPNRQCIVTGSETGNILLFDINSKKVRQVLKGGHGTEGDPVLAVSSHDSQELLASGGMTQDKTVQFWAAQSISQTWSPNKVDETLDQEMTDARETFGSVKRRASQVG